MSARGLVQSQRPAQITPPGSLVELPPTPPPTEGKTSSHSPIARLDPLASRFLRELKAKASGGTGFNFKILPGAYCSTLEELETADPTLWNYISDKARHDLINDRELELRMPSIVHEVVSQKLGDAIKHRLSDISQNPTTNNATEALIAAVDSLGSARVRFSKTWHREPDQQFKLKGLRFPGLVIETAHTQSRKSVARAAEDFIVESWGAVQCVVGIEIDPKTPQVKISLWRPQIDTKDGEKDILSCKTILNGEFLRNEEGEVSEGAFTLFLSDIGPKDKLQERYPGVALDQELKFTYAELVNFVAQGEREQEEQEGELVAPPNMQKRRWTPSDEEELVSADEREYKRRERRAADKTEADDRDYLR